eukprot:TRINITY_DN3401_c0_g1_i1.p1 TRINITY_DN3401_c0_g1~~TRINITY_DN3401_c0_g1_i1.p1  ORF type:complete len:225 (-),score=37.25 TRINITY_DN3401_c0_g1_i1:425-1099(-)
MVAVDGVVACSMLLGMVVGLMLMVGALVRRIGVLGATVSGFAGLVLIPASFPIINLAFPPERMALLYVVGDRVAPDYTDGDVMVTSSSISVSPGRIVLHRNFSQGGLAFDGLKTPIRLRRVASSGGGIVWLEPTIDNNGSSTGNQQVPTSQLVAGAVFKLPYLALPLRWLQTGKHLVSGLPSRLAQLSAFLTKATALSTHRSTGEDPGLVVRPLSDHDPDRLDL